MLLLVVVVNFFAAMADAEGMVGALLEAGNPVPEGGRLIVVAY